VRIKKIAVSASICFVISVTYAFAQDGAAAQPASVQPQPAAAQSAPEQTPAPVAAATGNTEKAPILNIPATSYWGVRGLSQTVSAEPIGAGRVNIAVFGSYFKQEQDILAPSEGTEVYLGRAAFAWGVNKYVDVFALVPMNYVEEFHVGEIVGGGQFSLPLPEEWSFIKLAAQLHLIYGLTTLEKKITLDTNYIYGKNDDDQTEFDSYAGYDFFDTRGSFDVVAKLAQSLVLNGQSQRRAIKMHINEGISFTTGKGGTDWLLLLAAGLEIDPIEFLTIGAEFSSRTRIEEPKISDPFWFTPSIMYRSPWNFGFLAGVDISIPVKNDRKDTKPLECWRVFGDLVVSFDLLAPKREAEARRAKEEAAEKARLEAETKRLAAEKEGLAQKAVEDSIRAAEEMARRAAADSIRAKAVADSLANLMDAISQKAREDSVAMATSLANAEAKRVADSLALAETQKNLAAEKAKRSEAEQYLLTTGMLVLDAVYFTSGKTDLHINSRPYLGTIAKMLVKYPKLKIEIGGHTDNIGRFETNMNLSQRRAEAVFLLMVNTEPSLAQMLTSRGYGSTVPKADNKTAGGREINRRVELKVLNPEVLKDYNP